MTRGETVDLRAITDRGATSGIENGDVLVRFAEAIVGGDGESLRRAREDVTSAMGSEAMVDAAGVASNFQRMVRIADATGIPLGEGLEKYSREVREELGLSEPSQTLKKQPAGAPARRSDRRLRQPRRYRQQRSWR